MRHLATIQKIIDIKPIENADAIECATVLGWHVVVKKGEFNIGDRCVYFEIDSLLPMIDEFAFLAKAGTKKTVFNNQEYEGYRLRTIKLRGQISQGLCLPISILDGKKYASDKRENPVYDFEEGCDVTELLGVIKYEPPMPASLGGQAKGFLPGYIPKTDETRIQSAPKVLVRHKDKVFYVTEKVDGSSVTIFFDKLREFNVASRTINWKEDDTNSYWRAARALNIEEKLKKHMNIALQGELVGENIQSNRLKLKGQTIMFYNAYDIEKGKFLDFKDFQKLLEELELPMVPLVFSTFMLPESVDNLVEFATRKSLVAKDCKAEGIVIRSITECQDEELGRLSFKTINPEYLLEHGE